MIDAGLSEKKIICEDEEMFERVTEKSFTISKSTSFYCADLFTDSFVTENMEFLNPRLCLKRFKMTKEKRM